MKFDPNVEKKNPIAYFIVAFFLGMVIGFIGWLMNESTKLSTANVGVWLKRLALFDFILNTLRKKPLWYNGKGTTDSIQDKIENKLSTTWVKILKVFYVAVFVIVLILL